ncbi:protein phosphatase [Caloramator quimbayensis]|uniref:Protein phosphatase n=1 Tax=Caloramator quimbayensis TaxID=1147123 RepID=A0A1T4XS39_9CLOT|nr:Stp1/IreP family PP2C-type Ser/Thr phosphatase [Caloramator quimbayensis]SKA92380.1 protein phosphatase [Caloramator quimbayensis]
MLIECRTDKGKVRDINEDYIMVFKTNKYSLIIVADGMGGHNAGEIASKLACITVRDFISQNYITYDNNEELIRDALVKANNLVYEESQNNINYSGMGTTITCCLISNDELYLGHVGDSRAYIVNENGIKKITEDHSYVQELINNGSITENEAVSHPQRNLITRAIGAEKYVVVDTKHETIKEEDYIILCTDGLTSYLSNDEIKDLIIEYGILAVDKLINIANDRGGYDNISVIVAKRGDEK